MSAPQPPPNHGHLRLLRNWLSLSGLLIAVGSLFSFLLLLTLDAVAHLANPYVGVHWHMSISNRVEYIAADQTRQKIPVPGTPPKANTDNLLERLFGEGQRRSKVIPRAS